MSNPAASAMIQATVTDRILHLEISRRDKKNALTISMYQALSQHILAAQSNAQIRVIYLHAQADGFTAGNDLNEFLGPKPTDGSAAFDFLRVLANCAKPIVAAVGGQAIGIGTTLLLHCDLVIASADAQFRLPFVNLGLSPEGASSYLLPLLAGSKLSNELLFSGNFFDSATALRAGIINTIVAQEDLLLEGLRLCEQLASKPTAALLSAKALMKKHHLLQINQSIDAEFAEFTRLLQQSAAQEILQAFIEKRSPNPQLF